MQALKIGIDIGVRRREEVVFPTRRSNLGRGVAYQTSGAVVVRSSATDEGVGLRFGWGSEFRCDLLVGQICRMFSRSVISQSSEKTL